MKDAKTTKGVGVGVMIYSRILYKTTMPINMKTKRIPLSNETLIQTEYYTNTSNFMNQKKGKPQPKKPHISHFLVASENIIGIHRY
jgi:hypothetical protein